MDVLSGFVAAFCWGLADFLGGPAARRSGIFHVMFFINALSLSLIATYFCFVTSSHRDAHLSTMHGALAAIAGSASLFVATLLLSRALRSGKASVVSPIAMSYGTVTALLSWTSGESIPTSHLIGMALCCIGIPLTGLADKAFTETQDSILKSIAFSSGSMVCFGLSYWIQGKYAVPAVGGMGYLLSTYTLGTVLGLFSFRFALHHSRVEPQKIDFKAKLLLSSQAVFSMGGLGAFTHGVTVGSTSAVAVLSSFSGAVTAVLAWAIRDEKIARIQVIGILVVVIGTLFVRI